MSTAASLMPYLTLQLGSTRISPHQLLALLLYFIGRVDHPFICEGMFRGSNSAITDIFGKVSNICEDFRFRDLRKACTWINSKMRGVVISKNRTCD